MKLTNKLKSELREAYHCAMQVSILDMKAPLRYINQYFAEDINGFGTAADEKVTSREDCRKMVMDSRKQSKGMIFKSRKITPYRPKFIDETTAQFRDEIIVQIGHKKNMHSLHLWFSTLFKYRNNKWQMVLFHGSMPDAGSSSADTFHVAEAEKKLKKLEQVVAQRTADLQAKTRELEIEASLERVRAVTMGMNKPGDILDICKVFFTELQSLGFTDLRNTLINFWDDENGQLHDYDYSDFAGGNFTKLAYSSHPAFSAFQKKIRKAKDAFAKLVINKDGLKSWQQRRRSSGEYKDPRLNKISALYYYFYSTGVGALGISTFSPISKEEVDVLKKFRNVFDMAYQRYIDIQKAELQAREAQIEVALERIRAASLAMKDSSALSEIIFKLYGELTKLDAKLDRCFIMIVNRENKGITWWMAGQEGLLAENGFFVPMNQHPSHLMYLDYCKKRKKKWTYLFEGKEKRDWDRFGFTKTELAKLPEPIKAFMAAAKQVHLSGSSDQFGSLVTGSFEPLPEEQQEIISRFAVAFNQAYTRFLDLQKAEEQAREAQIQLALERVRARTMAMQKSDELPETSHILFEQMKALGEPVEQLTIGIVNDENKAIEISATLLGDTLKKIYNHSIDEPYMMAKVYKAWKKQQKILVVDLKGDELNAYNKYRNELTNSKMFPTNLGKEQRRIVYAAFFSKGMLALGSNEPRPSQSLQLLERFASVFDLTYTRFLDLQKAEAQAREAQIEAALERVRSRSMGMQKSEELKEAASVLHKELRSLDIGYLINSGYVFIDEENNLQHAWMTHEDGSIREAHTMPLTGDVVMNERYKKWKDGVNLFSQKLGGEKLRRHLAFVMSQQKKAPKNNRGLSQLPDPVFFYCGNFSKGYLHLLTREELTEASVSIISRFTRVFEQTFTRFLDLKKAEAQAREAKIEAALERVRSRSLAMHSSGELGDVVTVVLNNLMELGYVIEQGSAAHLVIFSEGTKDFVQWSADPALPHAVKSFIPYTDLPILTEFWDARQKGHDFFTGVYSFDEKNTWFKFAFEHSDLKYIPGELKKLLLESETYAHSIAIEKNSAIIINSITGNQLSENQIDILKRFSKVFEQAYVRFLDLQKAEAQAREAQIEASLERIRGKVTSMQESSELLDIVVSMRREFVALSHEAGYFWYMRWLPDKYEKAMTSGDGTRIGMVMTLPRHIHGDIKLVADWEKSDEPALVFPMDVETAVEYVDKMITLGDFQQVDHNAPTLDDIRHIGGLTFVMARTTHGEIGYSLPGVVQNPQAEDVNTLVRFAVVFDLAYRRFEDLKEAERRNRETQVELALERVRSRSMAMHKSEELKGVIKVVLEQFVHLNINVDHAGFYIDYKAYDDMHIWLADPNIEPFYATFPYFDTPTWNSFLDAKAKGKSFFTDLLKFEEKNKFYKSLFQYFEVPEDARKFYLECKGLAVSTVLLDNVGLYIENFDAVPYSDEENNILIRFGKVFQQTYTRFLDLQKAEAQAKEAQIEAALERVRSRTMAMQKSDELLEAGELLCSEMNRLGITSLTSGYVLMDADEKIGWNYTPNPGTGKIMPAAVGISHVETAEMQRVLECWKNKNPFFIIEMDEVQTIRHQTFIAERSINFPLSAKELLAISPKKLVLHNFNFKEGYILIVGGEKLTDDQIEIMLRFTNVFQQTYTRFLDLQKAEAQAREAQIEAALEKVRSRSLAMQQPKELTEVAELLRKEMGQLGVEELETSSIYIVDKENEQAECWYAIKDIREESNNLVSDELTITFADTWVGNEMGRFFGGKKEQNSIVMKGDKRKEWINYCAGKSKVLQGYYGDEIPERTYHLVKFNGGYMGAASLGDISAESWDLLRRAASVFSLAYTRFNDLKIAEAHALQAEKDLIAIKEAKQKAEEALSELQATQKQLVQSEKMASLGELTAGIAHEIQNPLNFVNNFSEVSKELLDEMKEELEKGNVDDAREIMNDVIQNLEKINHHGKRADGIVKGMLQHSRSSSGQKELTDINALCDEYLRLAYHGLRAKDKSFNAKFETDLDTSIGKINILPQDLGRVVLNLINNAFYAVSERKKANEPGYEPTVTVSTLKKVNTVEIKVTDNGTGIPQKVLDKIFQPFFTTKPTGQGTGLGLSLSYDIVTKAHGGELKVETKVGEGTTFIIALPV